MKSYNWWKAFEATSSRCICGFYDLANNYKILAEDKFAGNFWFASGCYEDSGFLDCPLASIEEYSSYDIELEDCVGWLVA